MTDQQIEGEVEHRGELGGAGLVAQERLGVAHLLVGVLADRDLEPEAPGCERRQFGSRGGLNTPRAASAGKMAGKRRAVRAAWMRLNAASSDRRSSWTQYAYIEG